MYKRLLFCYWSFFTVCGWSQDNAYLQHQPNWKVSITNSHQYPCVEHITSNYFFGNDTLIDSFVYLELFQRQTMTYGWESALPPYSFCSGTYETDSIFEGYIRSNGKKMFIRPTANGSEFLLYDFDLTVGDTLPPTYLTYPPVDTMVVTAIDSIYTANGYLRSFQLAGTDDYVTFLIEGIGTNVGFIETQFRPYNVVTELLCYAQEDQRYFPFETSENCLFYLETEEWSSPRFSISPNPATDRIRVTAVNVSSAVHYSMEDLNGRILKQGVLAGQTAEIEIDDLKNGSYLLLVFLADGQIFNQKFIKQ